MEVYGNITYRRDGTPVSIKVEEMVPFPEPRGCAGLPERPRHSSAGVVASQRYWDSDCFLGWLQAEPDKEAACEQVLEEVKAGNVLIVTSALTLSEVLMLRGKARIPKRDKDKVEQFFRSKFIVVRNITRRIAETSRSLVWDQGIKPKDALHVATCLDAKLPLFNTFDAPLIRKCKRLKPLGVTVERPQLDEPKLPLGNGHVRKA